MNSNPVSALDAYTISEFEKALITRDNVRNIRLQKGYIRESYFLDDLITQIKTDINLALYIADFEIEFINRVDFAGDIVFKSTKLIKENKDTYINEVCPNLKKVLLGITIDSEKVFEEVEQKGIYVNAKINSKIVFKSLQKILDLKSRYGEGSIGEGKDIVIDYSSPNAAKSLHAGHIRSTIIGHVLGNLYDANGYTVHRINFLNDWGGVGNLIEGLRRWGSLLTGFDVKNELLAEIYTIFRRGQKYAEREIEFDKMGDDTNTMKKHFGDFNDFLGFKNLYEDFKSTADDDFKKLEAGQEAEFNDWQKIVKWSLEDFNRFYNILDIHQEYLLGESLYSTLGKKLVDEELKKGGVLFFDENLANLEIKKINEAITAGILNEESGLKLIDEVKNDIGGYVIMLANFERYVVLKGNESTIYATRDLASIKYRLDLFNPTQIIYEVGQEQQDHFKKLFESGQKLFDIPNVSLKHIYHGFYVNDETKKKLSSRDGASNIMKLLENTVDYFYHKYDDDISFSESEKRQIAQNLGIGSIVFNDIKKDKKTNIGISSNEENMFKQFEESGGAYIIYATCRAKSILKKYEKIIPSIQSIDFVQILDIEVDIIKRLLDFPQVVKKAARDDDPVKVTEYLGKLASAYNSYYNAVPILKGDFPQRIIITKCVSQVIDNGLTILHINTLDRI